MRSSFLITAIALIALVALRDNVDAADNKPAPAAKPAVKAPPPPARPASAPARPPNGLVPHAAVAPYGAPSPYGQPARPAVNGFHRDLVTPQAQRPAPALGRPVINRTMQPGAGHPMAPPLVSHPAPPWHPVNPRQPVVSLAQHMSRCAHGIAQVSGCAVWARMRSPADQTHLTGVEHAAVYSQDGTAHETWIGDDNVQREVWIVPGPQTTMYNVQFLPMDAALVPASTSATANVSAPGDNTQVYGSGNEVYAISADPTAPPSSTVPGAMPSDPVAAPSDTIAAADNTTVGSNAAAPRSDTDPKVGKICRPLQVTAAVGDQQDEAPELQCRDANGTWRPARQLLASD